ncbi:zinc finger protein ZFP2-like [Maniola hyperantus]|uniref:zinc finger protein ZFP2-like n=1 Tax=Aphantopus hyperantus TaxID=2795564 RepID=UPI0037490039
MINRTKHQLKSNMVLTTLGPDHWDLHILEHPSEDKQTELEGTEHGFVIKTEESDDFMLVDEDMEVKKEDDSDICDFAQDMLKYEVSLFQCTLCSEEFVQEHAYMQHMSMHLQNGDGEYDTPQVCKPHTAVSCSSSHSPLITENRPADPSPSAHAAMTLVACLSASLATTNKINVPPTEAGTNIASRYKTLPYCYVKLYDIFTKKVLPTQDGSLMKTSKPVSTCVSPNITSYPAKRQNEVPTTEYIYRVTNEDQVTVSNTFYICDFCQKMFEQKSLLVKHIKIHASLNRLTCKICQHQCRCKSHLIEHMRTHTGEKPFTCKLCNYKCARNSSLVMHVKTHTGEKPYLCTICDYKCVSNSKLLLHMRTHTGEKPFTCKLCNYKCAQNSSLVSHMRTHTGEKPFTCKQCNYKCAQNSSLVSHMRTHTGEKPFTCKQCNYKCAQTSTLVSHMRTHTGIKPYTCKFCKYKSAENSNLVRHMRLHTCEKPRHCKLCDYKCDSNSKLMRHMKTHPGEKPSSCS